MEKGYYVLLKTKDVIICKYVSRWLNLIDFLESFEAEKIFVTLSFSDFIDKLKEWREKDV